MIEKTVYDYLTTALNVPVYMQIPDNPNPTGASYVVIEKTGSSYENHLFTATLAIQSYAPTMYEAACLNEDVKQAMFASVILNEITRIDLNSDYNFTDIETRRPRYQAVFDITHY